MKKVSFTVLGLGLFGILVLYLSSDLAQGEYRTGYGPGFYPRVLTIVLFILLAALFWEEWTKRKKGDRQETESTPKGSFKYPAIFLGLMVIYALILDIVGFIIDTTLFLFVGMMILRAKPIKALIVSILVAIALYYTFGVLLLVQLPKGYLLGG